MDRNEKANITIGVGLTTTPNRKHLLDAWLINFRKHTKEPYHLHIHEDNNYRGVAYSKNENLKALKDCDYIFLFDDDCFPIHDDWVNFFVSSGENHLLFLNEKLHGLPNYCGSNPLIYQNCGGVFMMITKDIVKQVGGFDTDYGKYSFEHVDYSNRILGKKNNYPMLKDTNKYLKALDYEGLNKSSMSDDDKQYWIKKNWNKYFNEEIKSVYLPL